MYVMYANFKICKYFSILQKMCNVIYHYNEDQIVTVIASYFAYLPSTYRGRK